MSFNSNDRLFQRSDYTHKYNLRTGRHGWLRLTPAYSVKIVEEIIEKCERPMRILDPFCGTATTALSAAYHGHEAVTTDINPFLVWLGKAKTDFYAPVVIERTRKAAMYLSNLVGDKKIQAVSPPSIHKIERWWSDRNLEFLCQVRAAIDTVSEDGSQERTLLLAAFCRTLIALSNAAFNHQSMSFKDSAQLSLPFDDNTAAQFLDDVHFILAGAAQNPEGTAAVVLGDARDISLHTEGRFDRVITSPPYANRMSYVRELRPYMYWLGYLENGREAGELDWSAIGGTWGIATSRLNDWQPTQNDFENQLLQTSVENIANEGNKNGRLLSNYVLKYFDDMWMHFKMLRTSLAPRAEIHYIVGNSSFYGVLLPVEQILADMLNRLGFEHIRWIPLRKRNSKKELIEFDVVAIWND